jgi:glycosyltransferase involved in cell wall biosynthesis
MLLRIANLPNKKICYFHGITPSKFLTVYEPITAELCEKGFKQIPLLNKFDFVVCNSLGTAKLLNGTVDQKRIKVFPPFTKAIVNNGTVSNFVRNRDVFNIVQLGRVAPHKALEDGVRIIKDLKDQHAKISLCIVGSIGNQSYKDDLDRLIEELGLSDRVFFTGFVDEQVKLEILAASDLMLSTSYHEGYGIPIIEAMGMGLLVLVRKNAIHIDSFNSHILEFDDIQNAAEIIKMLLSDDHFRDCFRNNAKTFAKIIFEATNDDETYSFYKNNFSIF